MLCDGRIQHAPEREDRLADRRRAHIVLRHPSKRVVPLARGIMAEIEQHLGEYVAPGADALIFTSTSGGPLYRGTFWPPV